MKKSQRQFILGHAWPVVDLIVEYIKLQPGVDKAAIAGSIRRGLEIVRNINIVVASSRQESLGVALSNMPGVEQIVGQGGKSLTLVLSNGLICHIYIVSLSEYALALFHYTGSAGYVTKVAEQATSKGLLLEATSLRTKAGEPVSVSDEQELYTLLNASYIEPELREDDASLKAAGVSTQSLVNLQDICGIFHVHTTYSDGSGSLTDMAEGAQVRGWRYLGIGDHSQTAVYARGLRVETIMSQRREIEKLNAANPDFIILSGIESDILPDGSLDYPDEILASFDFVVASVHSSFRQSEADMTCRIVRAMHNRYVTMLGHPTGRLLLRRKGYAVNLPEVIKAAAQSGTIVEINASPYRLDLDWRWCRIAKAQDILFAINPDAHAVGEYEHLRYGVAVARKAGLAAADIVNTRSYPEVVKLLQRKR